MLFALKLIRNMLLTMDNFRHIKVDIEDDCPFGNKEEQIISHILHKLLFDK